MISFGAIESNIFIGSAPQGEVDVARLKTMSVTAVLSLQSDADFKYHRINITDLQRAYDENDILLQRFPIIDFDEQDLGKKLAAPVHALHKMLEAGYRVYVHCNAGVCRAPATVLTYLCHYRGMTVEQGLRYIRDNRPQANPYPTAVVRALAGMANSSDAV